MKKTHLFIIIALVVLADQALKIWVKTSFLLNTAHPVLGERFQLYFVENPGMAYGWKFGGNWGKIALTVFRMAAVVFGTGYLTSIIRRGYAKGFIICAGLIYAGALGNLLDSCFYGLIFDRGMVYSAAFNDYLNYSGVAHLSTHGYAGFLHGDVVDMLYFPVIRGVSDVVSGVGQRTFEFFRPIFNIADASITVGVLSILLFQRRFFKAAEPVTPVEELKFAGPEITQVAEETKAIQ